MYALECVLALLRELPEFLEIIFRHAMNVLGAM